MSVPDSEIDRRTMQEVDPSMQLSFIAHNPGGSTILLLIHGAFGSPADFDPLVHDLLPEHLINDSTTSSRPRQGPNETEHKTPEPAGQPDADVETSTLLTTEDKDNQDDTQPSDSTSSRIQQNNHYHVLIPFLPLHNPYSRIGPLTVPHAVSLLASALASTHPGLISSVFMTGFNIFGALRWRPILPGVLFTLTLLEGTIMCPRETGQKIKDWILGRKNVCDHVRLCGAVIDILFSDRELGMIDGEMVRVAIVAATKEGWIPKDKVESARRLFESVDYGEGHCHENGDWEERKGKARVVQHKGLTHAWPVDEPELMGRTIRAWVERGEILEGFEDL